MPIQSDEQKLSIYRDPAVAQRYDERWEGAGGQRRDERTRRAVERGLTRLGGLGTILDVPCGAGRFSAWLSQISTRYVGADVALPMLREARGKCAAPLVAGDLTRLPFRDASFDTAICIRLMHLVRERELRLEFLRELARVARRGVVVDYLHAESLKVWYARARASLGLRDHAPSAMSHDAIRAELDAAGLDLVGFESLRAVPYLSDKVVVVARPRR